MGVATESALESQKMLQKKGIRGIIKQTFLFCAGIL